MAEARVKIEGIKNLIVVASGKGGVGKSTVSVNLALALAGLGYKVGLFDADVHGPNIPLMLGARRKGRAEQEAAMVMVAVTANAGKNMSKGRALERFGLKVMSLGLLVGEEQPIIPDTILVGSMVVQLLRSTEWGELDYLLVDLPPGTGEPQITLSQRLQIDGVVLVSTPADVALLDTTRALNLYRDRGIKILGLVENMSYYVCPCCGDKREIFPRSNRQSERTISDVPIVGRIPLNPEVGITGDDGRPLVITNPDGDVAQAFFDVAREILKAL